MRSRHHRRPCRTAAGDKAPPITSYTLAVAITEAAAIEAEMILEEALTAARERLSWYHAHGEANTTAVASCRERIAHGGMTLAAIEVARIDG